MKNRGIIAVVYYFICEYYFYPKGALTSRSPGTPRTPETPMAPPVILGLPARKSTQGKGVKTLSPSQMLQKLPILLAQV